MGNAFEELTKLDKLIHEPARLAILTALDACQETDFLFLSRLTGLNAGNLSAHLSKLENAKLVETEKRIVAKRMNTHISITEKGSSTIEAYWETMKSLHNNAKNWRPDD